MFSAPLSLTVVLATRPINALFSHRNTVRPHLFFSDLIFFFISTLILSSSNPLFCAFNLPVSLLRCPLPSLQAVITELSDCFPVCHPENERERGGGIIVHNGRKKGRRFHHPSLITRVTNHHQDGGTGLDSLQTGLATARLHTVTLDNCSQPHTEQSFVRLMCCTQLCSLTS